MRHVLFRIAVNFYMYGCGMIVTLGAVNWWRRRRGYRTTLDRAHEED